MPIPADGGEVLIPEIEAEQKHFQQPTIGVIILRVVLALAALPEFFAEPLLDSTRHNS